MEHIEVSDKIMDKLKDKEKHSKRLERCLSARICPKCGEDLSDSLKYEGHYAFVQYNCVSCRFSLER